jgi:hypothetical protein
MDDLLVHGTIMDEHDRRLSKVINIINAVGLHLYKEKYKLRQSQLQFLGYVFDADGMYPDIAKVKTVRYLSAAPMDVAEVRRVLGMFNYLGRYISYLSTILQPLNKLLGSNVAWTWGVAETEAYSWDKELI